MKKILLSSLVLFSLAGSAQAEEVKSKDKFLVVQNETYGTYVEFDPCPTKKKCKNLTYRLVTTELSSKNKVVKNTYSKEKKTAEEIELTLKSNTKYAVALEQKSGKKWLVVSTSKVTFKTPREMEEVIAPTTQLPTPTPSLSIVPKSTLPVVTTEQVKTVTPIASPVVPFVPIQFSAYSLDKPKLEKNKTNQQVYKARFIVPNNRDVTVTSIVVGIPKEMKLQNLRLFLGQNEFGKIAQQTETQLGFTGNIKIPAGTTVDLTVYGDLPSDVPTGTGKSVFLGMGTTYSGMYYEAVNFSGVEPICSFEIMAPPAPVVQTQQQPIIDLGDGLKLQLSQVGTGTEVTAGKQVAVHYIGTLENGTKFDSSVDRGQPFVFTVGGGQVIQGWDRALAGRKVGDQFRVYIPSNLGYGSQSVGNIPANSNLIFDILVLATQ